MFSNLNRNGNISEYFFTAQHNFVPMKSDHEPLKKIIHVIEISSVDCYLK